MLDAEIARRGNAAMLLPEVLQLCSKLSAHQRRVIRGAVVDHEQLEIALGLREHGVDGLNEHRRAIKGGDDDGDEGHVAEDAILIYHGLAVVLIFRPCKPSHGQAVADQRYKNLLSAK